MTVNALFHRRFVFVMLLAAAAAIGLARQATRPPQPSDGPQRLGMTDSAAPGEPGIRRSRPEGPGHGLPAGHGRG